MLITTGITQKTKVITPPQREKKKCQSSFVIAGGSSMVAYYLIRRFFWFSAMTIFYTCHLENITYLCQSQPIGRFPMLQFFVSTLIKNNRLLDC